MLPPVIATASGAGSAILVADRGLVLQSDGGGFGPPPPAVPFAAPGEKPRIAVLINGMGLTPLNVADVASRIGNCYAMDA